MEMRFGFVFKFYFYHLILIFLNNEVAKLKTNVFLSYGMVFL